MLALMRKPTTRWSVSSLLALTVLVTTLVLGSGTAAVADTHTGLSSVPTVSSVSSVPSLGGAPAFGTNVKVFDPSMPVSEIKAQIDAVSAAQVDAEMGSGRYALLFKPGTYGSAADPLVVQVGYYTEVAGLGLSPSDVVINGHIDVYNRCLAPDNCIALNNFWRSMSNLTINVTGETGCRSSANFWAVSQAAPLRRVHVTGGTLSLMDYCTAGPQYASGGFMADTKVDGQVVNGSQQQFIVRNGSVGSWSNAVWNQVFAGVTGAPAQSFPTPQYTTLATTPLSRERPYLYVDSADRWWVRVPSAQADSSGTTWEAGVTPGRSIPLSDFFVASPSTPLWKIDAALLLGKQLLLQPGLYNLAAPILIARPNSVVLGLGFPTLTPTNGTAAVQVADVPGAVVAGLMIDAGAKNSPALMRVGLPGWWSKDRSSAANPTTVSDVFFRVGGPHAGRATVALEVNSDRTLLDDIWAWRADHGEGVGWTVNPSDTGVVVRGDDVVATGLFSEHFQKDNVIWSGERGKTVFFQNELPYDAPDQAAWRQPDGTLGYAGYRVADSVKTHELWGGGAYIYTNVNPSLHASQGFRVPDRPGVKLHDLLTVSLNNAGTIDHVVNTTGDPAVPGPNGANVSYLVSYP